MTDTAHIAGLQREFFAMCPSISSFKIAAAAELVMGQGAEATPVAIIKGLDGINLGNESKSSDLIMPTSKDLYRGAI